jgi:macrolide transport system ATP-binding/permease protein
MFNLKDDVRLAVRRLRQRPGFTLIAVLTLALGLGANTAIFTLIRASMFQKLPVDRPHELVRLGDDNNCCVNSGIQRRYSLFSVAGFQHLRDNTPELASLTAFQANVRAMGIRRMGRDVTESLPSAFVAANYFTTLGVQPAIGRLLTADDDRPGAEPVFVVSHRAWTERFGRDERIVGASFLVGDHTMTLVGVAAEDFFGETVRPDPAAVWLPLGQEPAIRRAASLTPRPGQDWLYAIGRLGPGATREQVQMRVSEEMRKWLTAQTFLGVNDRATIGDVAINVAPAAGGVELLQFTYERPLTILFVMSGLVLLIASANLANLLLARSDRSQAAIQTALGASSRRLVRQSLTEGIVLATAGGLAGVALAWLATRGIVALAFPGTNYVPITLQPDFTVLAFAVGLSALTGVLFSAAPAWAMTRAIPMDALRSGRSGDQRSFVPRRSLVVLQVALSLVLLSGAGLLTESLRRLERQPLGFHADDRIVVRIQPPAISDLARLEAMYALMLDRLRAIPGVRNATYALYSPMQGDNWSSGISIDPTSPEQERGGNSSWNRVGPDYFETLGTRIVRGRGLKPSDDARGARVAVVNEAFVRRFLAKGEPIGAGVGVGNEQHKGDYRIVGVSEDVKFTNAHAPTRPMIFLPALQIAQYDSESEMSVQMRSLLAGAVVLHVAPGAGSLEPAVRRALSEADPNLAMVRLGTMADQVSLNFRVNRLMASLTAAYGVLALVLASLGLYGVTAYNVTRRTREIGIRMALGADRSRVVRDVLRGALLQTGIGLLFGIPAALIAVPAALAATGSVASQLYGIDARDPTVLAIAVFVLIASAVAAAVIPARRAASIDPTSALRME